MSSAPTFRRLYAKLPARDSDRARAFFAEKLGLEPAAEHDGYLHYELGEDRFVVYPSRGVASGTHDQIGFGVDDVDATVASLQARGVTFETYEPPPGASFRDGVMDLGSVRAAWFKDSEGNLISVAEFANGF